MQIRVHLATAVGAGVLAASGLGLALAGSASAAPTPVPPSPVSSTPSHGPSVGVPTAAPAISGAPGIEVPAGNAGTSSGGNGGVSSVEIAGLVAAGVVLAGGGTVMAIRRRS